MKETNLLSSSEAMRAPLRAVSIGAPRVQVRSRDGNWYMRAAEPLGAYPVRLTDRLVEGARRHPGRWLIARRDEQGEWHGITYAQMLERARCIGQALHDRGLSAERPLVILSGNDLEHIQVALGAMWAGVPYSPISPAYSLVSSDYGKLRHAIELLSPGLVFATDASAYSAAISATVAPDIELVSAIGEGARVHTPFRQLLDTAPSGVDAVNASLDADTIAKLLFTSGSTRMPKAVPTTHRMLCSNQQMLLETFPQFGIEPPVLVDWLPWNHTFGGSHNVGIALYNGGTLYIDDGKPAGKAFSETLRNLREIAPTVYFNVPKGWEELTNALETDATLRETFFSRVKTFFFAGAGLSQAAWNRLDDVTQRHCGERIRIMAGLGMTETSPSCLFTTGGAVMTAGYIGVPAPGCEVKLAPVDGKLELRFRGPHVMRGYWRADAKAAAESFDEEGYYRSGDAAKFADPERPESGLLFDGRIAEDFKLSSGTFVSVGPMRARVISEGMAYIQDVVVTGLNRDDVGLLVFPRVDACRRLAELPDAASARDVVAAPAVRDYFAELLTRLNRTSTGSATTIARMCLLDMAPSLDLGEITDKGSINQRAVLTHRAAQVDALHAAGRDDAAVILARPKRDA
jgi:feruloyl-CoA synthase